MLEVLTYHHTQDVTAMFLNNYDAMLNFNKDLTEKLNLEGNIGFKKQQPATIYLLQLTGFKFEVFTLCRIVEIYSSSSENFEAKWLTEYVRASLG
jgi:hypothetical protein